jgi:outer membrane protein assembly factor BamD (BamD/ComL family)
MILRRAIYLLLMISLIACSSQPTINEDPTIEQLAKRAAKIEPAALPPMSRAEVRKTYEKLASSTTNKTLKAIALKRLADLDLESKQDAISKGESLEDEHEQSGKKPLVAEEQQQIASKEDLGGAIHQYERLLELYPDYKGNDKVLYQLSRAYELNGQLDKTLSTLSRLIKQYPHVKNMDEIQFRRGEILFAFKKYKQAEQAYQNVINVGESSVYYGRALFKRGWSVFKEGDTQRSLRSYFAVLDRAFAGGRKLSDFGRGELELLEDTLRIVSLSFSYLKGPDSIKAFFDSYGARDYEFRIYEKLADLYLTQGRISDAADTFYKFIKRFPDHRQSPFFMVRLIDIYKQSGRSKDLLTAKANLITAYGIGTPFWSKHDKQLLQKFRPHLQENLDDLSQYYHAKAQKDKSPKEYRVAARWYRIYVHSFPEDPSTPEKNMLLAECLQESGDINGAAQEFENTAYKYPANKDSAEAGYAALLAYRKLIDKHEGKERIDAQRRTIAIAKRFVTTFPDDKRAVPVMAKAAEELFQLKDYQQAVATAHYVVSNQPLPDIKLQKNNWAIIADGEFQLGDYVQAEEASIKCLSFPIKDKKERKIHTERLAAAIYKQGEQARNNGHYREAAMQFLRIGHLVPDASIRANAQFDAAASLIRVEEWKEAIPVLRTFIKNYPDNKLRVSADEKLALAYEKTSDWANAAAAYEVLYKNEKDNNKKRLILWQTAQYYEKAKRIDDAIEVYKRYVAAFPMPFDEAIEARNRLATIYKDREDAASRQYWLRKIIEANNKGPATDRSRYLAANASLELALPNYLAYRNIKLVQPLKKNLEKKKKLMKESIKAYTEAANYDIEEVTTAATYRIAEIYNDFSKGLYASERPKNLSKEELEQYNLLLEDQAFPFEEKAIKIHEKNAKRAFDGIYDRWVKESFAALTKLEPARYAKKEKGATLINEIN